MRKISTEEYAIASGYSPASTRPMMYTVARLYFAVARKMTALTAVIAWVKLNTSVARIAGRRSGRMISRSVRNVDARSVADNADDAIGIRVVWF